MGGEEDLPGVLPENAFLSVSSYPASQQPTPPGVKAFFVLIMLLICSSYEQNCYLIETSQKNLLSSNVNLLASTLNFPCIINAIVSVYFYDM